MKRIGNLYKQFCSLENLYLADELAAKGKTRRKDVRKHMANQDEEILLLHEQLVNKQFPLRLYHTFTVTDPKERTVFSVPYYPHRIIDHAIMTMLGPILTSMFTADTYSCIKGRGVYAAFRAVKKALQDEENTKYCLKIDIQKFYPSIEHDVIKGLLRRKIKDPDLLALLDNIIDSSDGLPIGNYLSQHLANLVLTPLDHYIKETLRVRNYFRYMDDMVIFSASKEELHRLLAAIRTFVFEYMHLLLKDNYQIFPVDARGVDFLGYRFFHKFILLRKRIKNRFGKAVHIGKGKQTIASYLGWAKPANTYNLITKLLPTNEQLQRLQYKE